MKVCTKCKIEKPDEEFHKNRNYKDGLQYWCTSCRSKTSAEYYESNKEKIKRSAKEYQGCNKDRISECKREYRERNRGHIGKHKREYYERNKDNISMYHREHHLKKKYGITLEEYEDMVKEQDGICLICGDFGKRLLVDHCHKSGEIRGLLCGHCNTGLGFFRDNPDLLRRAADYVIKV